jgi:hypothetical protein
MKTQNTTQEQTQIGFFKSIYLVLFNPKKLFSQIENISMKKSFFVFLLFLLIPLFFAFYYLLQLFYGMSELTGAIGMVLKAFFGIGAVGFIMFYIVPLLLAIPFLFLNSYISKISLGWFGHKSNYKNVFNIFALSSIPIFIYYLLKLVPYINEYVGSFSILFFAWYIFLLIYGSYLGLINDLGKIIPAFIVASLIVSVISFFVFLFLFIFFLIIGLGSLVMMFKDSSNELNKTIVKLILSLIS